MTWHLKYMIEDYPRYKSVFVCDLNRINYFLQTNQFGCVLCRITLD